MKYGFVKVAAATPEIITLNVKHNTKKILDLMIHAHTLGVQIALFPELCVCGYSPGDTVFHPSVLAACEDALAELASATSQRDIVAVVGLPVKVESFLYNCMAVLARGQVAGLIPKSTLTRGEMRHFTPYPKNIVEDIEFAGFVTPFNRNLVVRDYGSELVIAVNHGGSFSELEKLGVNLVLQPRTAAKLADGGRVRVMAEVESREHCMGLVYAGACQGESHARCVFDTVKLVAECGEILAYAEDGPLAVSDIDVEKINYRKSRSSVAVQPESEPDAAMIEVKLKRDAEVLDRAFNRLPLVPENAGEYDRIMDILAAALYSRVKFTDAETMVVGVSGGLDSLTTLLVADKVCRDYDFPRENVVAVTMPCFASSERTSTNAYELIQELGMTHKHIPIHEAVANHLSDIGHDAAEDVTYENAQARERTQILLDLANLTHGIMLGTSDMSEEALGFSTFGGDQIAMFNVNSGLAKTTIRGLVAHLAESADSPELKNVIRAILDTPVSPELKKDQATEKIVGSYELHDFFLYHFLGEGCTPEKLLYLAERTFPDYPAGEIKKTLKIFLKRFFAGQFKRSASADGVQVFGVFLAPWAFSMNSDIGGELFL